MVKAAIFADTPENPTEAAVDAALAAFRANGCDGILAIGGGSAMDLGKALGVMATHPGRLTDYDVTQPSFKPVGAITPLVVVPTTAGTGTEVGVGCVIILDNSHKGIIDSFSLIPASVICDPELTVSLPARLTAATGYGCSVALHRRGILDRRQPAGRGHCAGWMPPDRRSHRTRLQPSRRSVGAGRDDVGQSGWRLCHADGTGGRSTACPCRSVPCIMPITVRSRPQSWGTSRG